ncbi:MAG: hypothetical protein PGN11_05845 [Quadrisphaera sp.]
MSAQTVDVELADVTAADLLDEGHARALTARIRTQLEHLDTLLLAAWRGRVWIALGHPTWDAWVTAELGAVRLRLPVEQRRALAAAWRAEGMSQRAIAIGLGVSKGTITMDLLEAPAEAVPTQVISLDGRRRRASVAPSASLAERTPISKQSSAVEVITAAGQDGVTVPELMKNMKWTQSQASACLSRLNRALDKAGVRTIERLAQRRNGHALYVLPAVVDDRHVLRPGERLAGSAVATRR